MTRSTSDRLTADITAVFSAAVLGAFPLYIDQYSNLGVTKFTAGMLLCLVFTAALAACRVVGEWPQPGRFAAARRDPGLWSLAAFVLVNAVSTLFALDRWAALWGLRGYYGGLALVLYGAAAYLAVRAFADAADADGLLCGMGWAAAAVIGLYALNVFGLDPLGIRGELSPLDKTRFFSTIGNKDFVSGALALMLPPVWYTFITARDRRRTQLFAAPALLGALAPAVLGVEGLLLGLGTAALAGICCRGFCGRHLRRAALLGAAPSGWAGLVWLLRRAFPAGDEAPLLVRLGPLTVLLCLAWLLVWQLAGRCPDRPLYRAGRTVTVLAAAAALAALALANLRPDRLQGTLRDLLVLDWDWGNGRGLLWHAAAGCWWAADWPRKLVGYGPSMMWDAVQDWAAGTDIAWPDRLATYYAAHNEYLEQLLTTGLAGLAAWLAFAGGHLWRAVRRPQRRGTAAIALGLVSYLAQAVVNIRVSAVFPLVMVLFGWLAALTADDPPAPPPPKPPRAAAPRPVRWMVVWLAAAAAMAVCGALAPVPFAFLY